MYQLYCFNRVRDYHGNVLQYILETEKGKTIVVGADAIRKGVQSGEYVIPNLSVAKNGAIRERKIKNTANYCYIDSYDIYKLYKALVQYSNEKGLLFRSCVDIKRHLAKYKLMGVFILNIVEYPDFTYIETDKTVEYLSKKQIKFRNSNLKEYIGVKEAGHFRKQVYSSIDLSQVDTSEMTTMQGMFEGCMLNTLNLSNFNTSRVIDMSDMFEGFVMKDGTLDVSMFDTSNVTNMTNMFNFARFSQPLLDITHFNTSKVKRMSGAFSGCDVQAIDIRGLGLRQLNMYYNNIKDEMFHWYKGKVIGLSQ